MRNSLSERANAAKVMERMLMELVRQSNATMLEFIDFQFQQINFTMTMIDLEFRAVEQELAALKTSENRHKQRKQQWNALATEATRLARPLPNRSQGLKRNFTALQDALHSCQSRFTTNLNLLQRLSTFTDPTVSIPTQIYTASSDLKNIAHNRNNEHSENFDKLTALFQRLDSALKSYDQGLRHANQSESTANNILAERSRQLSDTLHEFERIQAEVESLKRDVQRARQQKEQFEQRRRTARTSGEQIELQGRIITLTQEVSSLSGRLTSLEVSASILKFRMKDLRLAFEHQYDTLARVYAESTQALERSRGTLAWAGQEISNVQSALDSEHGRNESFCAQTNGFQAQIERAGLDKILAFEEKLDSAITRATKNSNGLVVNQSAQDQPSNMPNHGSDSLALETSLSSTEGQKVRSLWNRQLILENWFQASSEGFSKPALDLSADLLIGFDHALARGDLNAEGVEQGSLLIHTTQNYAAGVFSLSLGFVPIVSQVKDLIEVATGRDMITNEALSDNERVFVAVAMLVPVGGHTLSKIFARSTEVLERSWLRFTRLAAHEIESGSNLHNLREAVTELRRADLTRARRREIIETFKIASLNVRDSADLSGKTFYRWWGGASREVGYFATDQALANATEARRLLALPAENTLEFLSRFRAKPGFRVLEGEVAPKFGNAGGGRQFIATDLNMWEKID